MELPLPHGFHHVRPQHQIGDVLHGDHHALAPGEPECLAHRKVPLDLLVDAADGLDLSLLVDRPGDGDALLDRDAGQFGQQRVELGGTRAIPIHLRIRLFERQRCI